MKYAGNIKLGDTIQILNHILRVKRIYKQTSKSSFSSIRVSLSCRPQCCNVPNGLVIDCTLEDAEVIGKVWRFKEK
jgi:hypothetical protein